MIVHLMDGSEADSEGITFIPQSYHFFLATANGQQLDITNNLDRATKRSLVPDFNDQTENLRISAQGGSNHPLPSGDHGSNTSPYDTRGFLELFATGIGNDLRTVFKKVSELPKQAPKVLIPLAIIGVAVAYVIHKAK